MMTGSGRAWCEINATRGSSVTIELALQADVLRPLAVQRIAFDSFRPHRTAAVRPLLACYLVLLFLFLLFGGHDLDQAHSPGPCRRLSKPHHL
jgi:hypothetical protein